MRWIVFAIFAITAFLGFIFAFEPGEHPWLRLLAGAAIFLCGYNASDAVNCRE